MTRIIKWQLLLFALILSAVFGKEAKANTFPAASCNTSAVQAAINSASEGDTVTIPGGTCSWTSGVTIAGKGIIVQGSGSGRIVAYSSDTLTIGTGSKTVNIAGFSPAMSGSVFVIGQTMTLYATGLETDSMTGTVTSYSGTVLTMNIASFTGIGSTHRWFVATQPTTVLVNNSTVPLFSVTEDTSFDTTLGGFKILAGLGTGNGVNFIVNSGGKAIVLENCWIQQGLSPSDSVNTNTNRGVVSNCSFDSPTFSMAPIAFHMKNAPATSWTTPSTWGMSDASGEGNFYVETNDYEAYLNATDVDDNGRVVFRYNLMNNAGFGTHGADTSNYGQRYFEYYNNTGVFNAYSDLTTFNMNWWIFVRGGTYVIHDNTLPPLVSGDYGTKADVDMIVMNLQRNAGPNPCWGAGTSAGADYHAPRQVGMGYVTGTGHDGLGRTNDSVTYVGDSEPGYIWGNSRQPLGNIFLTNGAGAGVDCPASPAPDQTSNYIILNRDYFNGTTAKPGYTPYTYPHPLTLGESLGTAPAAPTGLSASVQ